MDYYTEKVNQIKRIVESNEYPNAFNKEEWKTIRKDSNCYAYALNIPVKDEEKRIWFPGCISNLNEDLNIYSSYELIERLCKDLEYLNLEYKEVNHGSNIEKILLGVYMISSHYDFPIWFHIARLDNGQQWSEKPSWDGKIGKVKHMALLIFLILVQLYVILYNN